VEKAEGRWLRNFKIPSRKKRIYSIKLSQAVKESWLTARDDYDNV
jgi:hypothetical protein